jgi:hypothetical protein
MQNFAHNFKKLFDNNNAQLGVIRDTQINHIFEKWEKYNLYFSTNELYCFRIYEFLSLGAHNYILVFPDSNKIVQTTYNVAISMSLIKNIVIDDTYYDDSKKYGNGDGNGNGSQLIKYDTIKFQPKYYNTTLEQICTGPTIIIVEMDLNSIILDKSEIPEYIEDVDKFLDIVNPVPHHKKDININLNRLVHIN